MLELRGFCKCCYCYITKTPACLKISSKDPGVLSLTRATSVFIAVLGSKCCVVLFRLMATSYKLVRYDKT